MDKKTTIENEFMNSVMEMVYKHKTLTNMAQEIIQKSIEKKKNLQNMYTKIKALSTGISINTPLPIISSNSNCMGEIFSADTCVFEEEDDEDSNDTTLDNIDEEENHKTILQLAQSVRQHISNLMDKMTQITRNIHASRHHVNEVNKKTNALRKNLTHILETCVCV